MARDRVPPPIMTPDHLLMGGARQASLDGKDAHKYLWAARVIHVDTETMVCSIRLETGNGERHDVPHPAFGGGGPRSWSGNYLEPGSKVLIGWKRYDQNRGFVPYIVMVLTNAVFPAREYEPFSTVDPADAAAAVDLSPDLADDPRMNLGTIRLKARKGYSGDFVASSSSGADIILDRDVMVTNRAGNEFRLRDSDQTSVLQTVNEFISNAAGQYRRGLVRRSAFNLLPDLWISGEQVPGQVGDQDLESFLQGKVGDPGVANATSDGEGRVVVDKVPQNSPAYAKFLSLGLIKEDGTPTFPDDPSDPFYPFVVTPDGMRQSFAVRSEHSQSLAEAPEAYVEDRLELRHTSDGVMPVTEEGDGVEVDPVHPVFIEDVRGTVVGNDPHSDGGRLLYKRILSMKVFDSQDDGIPSPGVRFEAIDTTQGASDADSLALCRLFKVLNPSTGGDAFTFGISKEGRVFLWVGKSRSGEEKGRSVDLSTAGLVKAVLGVDENTRTSLDLRTVGGVKLDIGAFKDQNPDPQQQDLVSVDLTLKGKVRLKFDGQQGREVVGTNDFRSMSGSVLDSIAGNYIEAVGGAKAIEAASITLNSGVGGHKVKVAGDYSKMILGKSIELYAQPRLTTFALADAKTLLAGIDATTVLAGGMARTVVAGSGITDTVATGNLIQTVGTGNLSATVGTGNLSMTVGAGNLALTAGAGNSTLLGLLVNVVASAMVQITAPVTKIGTSVTGFAVAGAPGPGGPHLDFLTGLPVLGMPNITLGP